MHRKFKCSRSYSFIHSFIFVPGFPLGRIARAVDLGGREKPHDRQQSKIVLLAPLQDGTKKGRRSSHATWSLDDLWSALPWV